MKPKEHEQQQQDEVFFARMYLCSALLTTVLRLLCQSDRKAEMYKGMFKIARVTGLLSCVSSEPHITLDVHVNLSHGGVPPWRSLTWNNPLGCSSGYSGSHWNKY